MPTFVGFNTQQYDMIKTNSVQRGADGGSAVTKPSKFGKKFRTTDSQLVIQDLINAFNIPQGQKPGNPSYGTTLWSFVFEPNTIDVQTKLQDEVRRIAAQDPRIVLNSINCYPQDNGILIEAEMSVTPFNNVEMLAIMFDQNTNRAYGA
jgi:phage baseplate assembly protein W